MSRNLLDIVATAAIVVGSIAVTWSSFGPGRPAERRSQSAPLPIPKEPVRIGQAARLGSENARVAVLAFSDFECPFCGRFATSTLLDLKAKYVSTGQVQFVFRHLPLPTHSRAQRAAETAECARRQGRFWDVHDFFFRDQKISLADASAGQLSVLVPSGAQLLSCVDQGEATESVRLDAAEASRLGITGTPAFLMGERTANDAIKVSAVLKGARPTADFEAVLDRLLALPK